MKNRPILFSALALTIVVEIALMVMVANEIGNQRLSVQTTRLVLQLIVMASIVFQKSNAALFLLTAYHVVSGLLHLYAIDSPGIHGLFGGYHIAIGLIIYFHDYLENLVFKKDETLS